MASLNEYLPKGLFVKWPGLHLAFLFLMIIGTMVGVISHFFMSSGPVKTYIYHAPGHVVEGNTNIGTYTTNKTSTHPKSNVSDKYVTSGILSPRNITSKLHHSTSSEIITALERTRSDKREKKGKHPRKNNQIKKDILILIWTTIYRRKSTKHGDGRFHGCEYSNCVYTTDRSDLEKSDTVIFHMWDLAKHTTKDLPPKRWPHQRWVLFGRESAVSANFSVYYDVEFNTTYTYKNNADVFFGYGCFSKRITPLASSNVINRAVGKSRLVAWVISHCNASSRRDDYIRELSKYIAVDGYGRCAGRACTTLGDSLRHRDPEGCDRMISDSYKLYLSFENSLCDGYITEKLWDKLASGKVVPVVLGGSNYSRLLPPNSFIDISNFTSPKALAKYLLKLDEDDSMYNSYFEWRRYYQISCANHECKLCEYLNKYTKKKVYTNIQKWWNDCTDYKTYYRGVANTIV